MFGISLFVDDFKDHLFIHAAILSKNVPPLLLSLSLAHMPLETHILFVEFVLL
jgi:hypothetical protein